MLMALYSVNIQLIFDSNRIEFIIVYIIVCTVYLEAAVRGIVKKSHV